MTSTRPSASERPRARDLGIAPGRLLTGPHNAITDVPGVRVGHCTLIAGDGPLVPGSGPVRTGATAILPHGGDLYAEKVAGCCHTINGFGELTNVDQIHELGVVEGPILLTNSLNVARVMDYVIDWALERYPQMGITDWNISPLVAETNDQALNDIRGRHVGREHVWNAIEGARTGPVAEGSVGGGTGMSCLGFKGGIGTASRRVDFTKEPPGAKNRDADIAAVTGGTVGVLVQTNFGRRGQLRIDGFPVGEGLLPWLTEADQRLAAAPEAHQEDRHAGNSIVIVVATDLPLTVRQLRRVASRATFGLARVGSEGSSHSGDFVIAFTTANRIAHAPAAAVYPWWALAEAPLAETAQPGIASEAALPGSTPIDLCFCAVIEATEEAILNALFRADTMIGRDHHVRHGLPVDETLAILRRHGYRFRSKS